MEEVRKRKVFRLADEIKQITHQRYGGFRHTLVEGTTS